MISRQRAYQLRKKAKGLCEQCGGKLKHYPQRCDACHAKQMEWQRIRRGNEPWRPGSRGYKPRSKEGLDKEG